MATERLKLTRPKVVQGRAYGPGVHTIEDREVARQLRGKGAVRVEGDEGAETEVETAAVESVEDLTGAIPEKFPYRTKLEENGVTTLDALVAKSRDELTQMEGIGEATADRILEALQELVDNPE